MHVTRFVTWLFSLGILVLGASTVFGQAYPVKPVRIMTTASGGGSDVLARLIAPGLSSGLGQQVIVDSRAGILAIEAVAKAVPDGYTLLLYTSVIWIEPLIRDNVPWDPTRDFSPISMVGSSTNVLVVHPSLPVKSVRELIALAKAKPGQLNYGSTSAGSSSHLAAEVFKALANVEMVRIPYKGAGPAMIGLIGGHVELMFPTAGSVISHVRSGKLRALGVTSAKPSALLPELPTVAVTVPGFESGQNYALFAPAKTPAPVINRVYEEVSRVLGGAELKQKMLNSGIEAVDNSSPEHLARTLRSEMARIGKVIKDAGIRIQ